MAWDEQLSKAPLNKKAKKRGDYELQTTEYADLVYHPSSTDPELMLAAVFYKPVKKLPIMVTTHGWHGSITHDDIDVESPKSDKFFIIKVDMRGRAFSDGFPDCNGLELVDVIDAVEYAKKNYAQYISDPEIVYLRAGSGGGGNVLALINKFPDYFTSASSECGISDYAAWYRNDEVGEFLDEMDEWIGCTPDEDPHAYMGRSGYYLCENQLTPVYLVHGELDERVPAEHSRRYVARAKGFGKTCEYLELKDIGGRGHYSNASPETLKEMAEGIERFLLRYSEPPKLPQHGEVKVGGYLRTHAFSIELESVRDFASIEYNIKEKEIKLLSDYSGEFKVEWK